MRNMTLANIAKACNGTYFGSEDDLNKEISGVEKDSRLIEEGYLYLPFVGNVVDGHDFINQVFEKGALCTLSEKKLENALGPYILVDSVACALKDIAEFYRENLNTTIIGITGSVGKTSTKEMIASVLGRKYNVLKTEGNYNNEIGMPLTILRIRDEHDVAVVEMGISDFGEMHRLSKIAKPDICVMTNIGTCHLENLGDRDGVLKAKSEIFDFIKKDAIIILNGDDDKLSTIKEVKGIKPVYFGVENDVTAKAVAIESLGLEGTKVIISYGEDTFETVIPVPGYHMVFNALAATCVGRKLNLTYEEIDEGIRSFKEIGGRNNIIKTNEFIIIDGCYNANPMSMKASINVLSEAKGRKVAILGDMFELGKNENELHKEIGRFAGQAGIDLILCVGKLSKNIAEAALEERNSKSKVVHFNTKEELEENLMKYVKPHDNILVKASNSMKFKTIVEKLTKPQLVLKNEQITIKMKKAGAELTSIMDNETLTEYLWCGDEKYWKRQAPILFPFVGSVKNKEYLAKGKKYTMGQHGFARDMDFILSECKNDEMWFELNSTDETKEKYPYDFKLTIGYRLTGRTVEIIWRVKNTGNDTLPFSIGGHPAFMCPIDNKGVQSDYYIITDAKDKLSYGEIDTSTGLYVREKRNELPLDKDGAFKLTEHIFDNDALIIDGKQVSQLSIADSEKKPYVTMKFDMPLCGIWSPAGKSAPFVCLEPWCGRCDASDFDGSIEEREYEIILKSGEKFETSYTVTLGQI